MRRALGLAPLLALAAAAAVASCSSDPIGTPPSATPSGSGGGGGGEVCVGEGDPCRLSEDPAAPAVCCPADEQCCEADIFGLSGPDVCRPRGDPCPIGCPGGDQACPIQQYCQIDPVAGAYACVADCPSGHVCDYNLCCPLGSECTDKACPLADLAIDSVQIAASAGVIVRDFAPDACEILEGCVGAPGSRALLRFDLETPNIGAGDLHLGAPEGNPLFVYSECHGHYHFEGYARYRLLGANDQVVAAGHKQAFCLLDVEKIDPLAPPPRYDCNHQGIQAGWADVYGRDLPCQWVDVTGVPPGDYRLEVTVNGDHTLGESSYFNNVVTVTVSIPTNTCPGGCRTGDPTCCAPGDPCGWGGDGSCDCADRFGWDGADCGGCLDTDPACELGDSCPAGCTEATGPCCDLADPCGLSDNGACDCAAALDWDAADCGACLSTDPDCPVSSCPNGCTPADPGEPCCESGEACGWAGDGYCDCGGAAWDVIDCASCLSDDPSCP